MRKSFGAKPYTYPQPVLIIATYNDDGTADAMNAAWGGITVSMADADHVAACDYVGIVSGDNEPRKLEKAGFTTEKSSLVDAPLIVELPMALECRLIRYHEATGELVGEIVNVSADERVLDEQGKIDPDRLRPIAFDPVNHTYRVLGEKVGNAFSDGAALK